MGNNLFYLKSFLFIALIACIDQFSKIGADVINGHSWWFVTIAPLKNYNVFLASFGELPVYLRTIALASLLGLIYAFAFVVQYMLVKSLPLLRSGITMLLGGITGNIIDKSFFGYVRDFISVVDGYFFNLADVFIVIGILLIIISIFKDAGDIWHEGCLRKTIFVDKKAQVSFSIKVVVALLFYFFTILAFSAAFMTTASVQNDLRNSFLIGISCLSCLFIIFVFGASVIISKKVIGPLYAFLRFVDQVESGDTTPLKLRQGDYFKFLEKTSERILQLTQQEKDK